MIFKDIFIVELKRIQKIIISFLLFHAFLIINTNAQKITNEGEAIFDITYVSGGLSPGQLASMPKTMIIYFKNGKSRMEFKNVLVISDSSKTISCTAFGGHKTATITTTDEMEKSRNKKGIYYDLKLQDSIKTIAGYKCKKGIITENKEENKEVKSSDFWFTSDLPSVHLSESKWKGVKGFLMEYTVDGGFPLQGKELKIRITYTCKSIIKKRISDNMFKIPDGYKIKDMPLGR